MVDWQKTLETAVGAILSGSAVAAVANWLLKRQAAKHRAEMDRQKAGLNTSKAEHDQDQEARENEVTALHRIIGELRTERNADRKHYDDRIKQSDNKVAKLERIVNKAKSSEMACYIRCAELTEYIRWLLSQAGDKEKIARFELEVRQFKVVAAETPEGD